MTAASDTRDAGIGEPREPTPPTKTTLFCASCGHCSPVDGDWTLRPRGPDLVAYYCPRCAKTIAVRPRVDIDRRDADATLDAGA